MRRLPVYFLIDVSESMIGEPIDQVQEGIANIIKELRTDPYALETVFVSIFIFGGKIKKISNLVALYDFEISKLTFLESNSNSSLTDIINYELDTSLIITKIDIKGDWKPFIILFTDNAKSINKIEEIKRIGLKLYVSENLEQKIIRPYTSAVVNIKNSFKAISLLIDLHFRCQSNDSALQKEHDFNNLISV